MKTGNKMQHEVVNVPSNIMGPGFSPAVVIGRGTRWRSWLRHCVTSQKVAGSISDGVTGILH